MDSDIAKNKAANNIFAAYTKALLNYFNFKGRTSRYDFWGFQLVNLLIMISLFILSIFIRRTSETAAKGLIYLLYFYYLTQIIPNISAIVRRFHDRGKSAIKWLLIPPVSCFLFMMLIGRLTDKATFLLIFNLLLLGLLISLLICLCHRGSAEDNKYGPTIIEDANQRWKGLFFPIALVILPFLVVFSMGFVGGYSRAMSKYKAEKIVPIINTLLADAKGSNGQPPIVEDDLSWHEASQPVGISVSGPFGGQIEIKLSKGIPKYLFLSASLLVAIIGKRIPILSTSRLMTESIADTAVTKRLAPLLGDTNKFRT